jgi:hypothetical protein
MSGQLDVMGLLCVARHGYLESAGSPVEPPLVVQAPFSVAMVF